MARRSLRRDGMHYVYLLKSLAVPGQRYVGITTDLDARLAAHNQRRSTHTAKFAPWEAQTYVAFRDPKRAHAFERYLKSASGFAFANKRLW